LAPQPVDLIANEGSKTNGSLFRSFWTCSQSWSSH